MMSCRNILLSVTATFFFALADTCITTPPEATTELLNINATFYCVSNESGVFWRVDGVSAVRTSVKERGITFVTQGAISRLLILASEQNNNSVVQCGTYCGGRPIISAPVILKVQGLLAPPRNLSFSSNNTATYLHWAPPFTHDISGIDPDITGYNIYYAIRIPASTAQSSVTVIAVPETYYTFTIHQCPLSYEFRVSALNGAGEGNKSGPLLIPCQQSNDLTMSTVTISLGATSYDLSNTNTLGPVSFAPVINISEPNQKQKTLTVVIAATGATFSCSVIGILSATILIKRCYAKHQAKAMEPEINMIDNYAYETPPEPPSGISTEANSAYGVFEIQ